MQAPSRDGGGDHRPPTRERLAHLHENALVDFLNPNGFGYVMDIGHVAGFQPHQFRQTPVLFTQENAPAGKVERWAVVRLELVSLHRHDRPCVYVADALPRMADSQEGPTRPLVPFERKALEALKAGDDLATESSGDRIRMVGSLRPRDSAWNATTRSAATCSVRSRGSCSGRRWAIPDESGERRGVSPPVTASPAG